MPTPPAFNPNAAYSVPAFDPNASFQADGSGSSHVSEAPRAYGFTPGNIISNIGTGLQQIGQGVVQTLSDVGGAVLPQALGGDPLNNLALVRHIVDPLQAEAAKARAAEPNGKVTAAGAAHAAASGVPIFGPWAANLAEQAATGDVGGAIARGGTQALAPKIIGPAAELATRGMSRAALLGKTPEAAYESALKPSTTLSQSERANIVNTGLENEIPVSKAGLEKIGDRIDALNQAIKNEIAADPTRPINTVPALRNLDSVRGKFANQVTPQPDLAEIDQVQSNFLNNPKVQPQGAGPGPASLPASEAQAMKQGTYQALGNKAYGEVKGASIEAQKALARGLKEEIANQFPEINSLNAEESRLFDLQPVLERAVGRISNHQLIGIGTPVAGAAAKAVTGSGSVGAVVGVLKAVLDNPAVKSRLAIAVSKASKVPISQAMARVQGYSASLGSIAAGSQGYSSADNPNQPATPQP